MKLDHPVLVDYLRHAYSAEKAASYAYIGHAGSLRDPEEIAIVRQIEQDEWDHRRHVLAIMQQYDIPISRFYELLFGVIGRIVGLSCYVLGRFMPELDSEMRLVWRLVLRESGVPVDAEQGSADGSVIGYEVGTDLMKIRLEVPDELKAGILDVLLVAILVIREPLSIVVLGEIVQVGEERGSKRASC